MKFSLLSAFLFLSVSFTALAQTGGSGPGNNGIPSDVLGFALKQTGTINMSYYSDVISVSPYESRIQPLWYRSEIANKDLSYTLTLKHGSEVAIVIDSDFNDVTMINKGESITFNMDEAYDITIISAEQYGLEVKLNEENAKPVLIQMSKASKYPATSFRAAFVKMPKNL